jgi:hypothetical protein
VERLEAIILWIGAAGSVAIDPANLSTTTIYGQSKRRQDLARLLAFFRSNSHAAKHRTWTLSHSESPERSLAGDARYLDAFKAAFGAETSLAEITGARVSAWREAAV